MSKEWTPNQYMHLVAGGTACLAMLAIIGAILIGVMNNTISPAILGDYKAGGGLLGVLIVLYKVIIKALG